MKNHDLRLNHVFDVVSQVQDGSPGQKAGLEAFFDFIVSIGNTRLVMQISDNQNFFLPFRILAALMNAGFSKLKFLLPRRIRTTTR